MRLLADFMLGKLARELRLLGVDCVYQKELSLEVVLKRAKNEERILLTRNTKLKDRELVLFITSEKTPEQICQVLKTFPAIELKPFTRCIMCNVPLVERAKESVKSNVPFYVFRTQERFYSCPECGKIYWRGTHYEDMKNRINQYLKNKILGFY